MSARNAECLRRHPISECSASPPDRRRRPGSAIRSSCSGPPLAWARSSAGPLLLGLRVVRAASIHRSTVVSLRVTKTRARHDMAGGAPARSTPQHHRWSSVLCRWMLAVGRTCEIRVRIRVMRLGRLGTINGADRLAILPLDACHVQTTTPLVNVKSS